MSSVEQPAAAAASSTTTSTTTLTPSLPQQGQQPQREQQQAQQPAQPVQSTTPVDIVEPTQTDLANSSSDSDWGLLGNLMIDLNPLTDQSPLKMQNGSVENRAPPVKLAEPVEKSLKMKIKRKSKEEKHEIVTPEMDRMHKVNSPKPKFSKCGGSKEMKKSIKQEMTDAAAGIDDPYSFKNVDEEISTCSSSGPSAAKKARVDKGDSVASSSGSQKSKKSKRDVSVNTSSVSTAIEPDNLGPCEPGTNISLDGIVWLETATGLLVVNVTWRGRTYVGTLLDSSQHEFAPPCPKDYVPPMETPRNQRGRGKRRGGANNANGQRGRRIGRQLPLSSKSDESDGDSSRVMEHKERSHLIKCPQHGCSKKFSDLQALKWHNLEKHTVRSPSVASCSNGYNEERAPDGCSVFKVPHAKLHSQLQHAGTSQQSSASSSKTTCSPIKTVTVTKTCPVPAGEGGKHKASKSSCHETSSSKKESDSSSKQQTSSSTTVTTQGPFKPIQPKPGSEVGSTNHAESNSSESREKKMAKKRRSPTLTSQLPQQHPMPPTLAPKCSTSSPQKKSIRKSDPVSPAYSDISDEGAPAPVLEKEECVVKETKSLSPVMNNNNSIKSSTTTSTTNATPNGPLPPPAHTPRGSPNAPSKPSLGHSPTDREISSKSVDDRRDSLDSKDSSTRASPRPNQSSSCSVTRPAESPRRPNSRSLGMVSPYLPPPPSAGPPFFDYRMFSPHGAPPPGALPHFMQQGYPFNEKAALEALGLGPYGPTAARPPSFLMPHKIHELAGGGRTSPAGRKTPPQMHLPPFSRAEHFSMPPGFSGAPPSMLHPSFLPPK